jgi:CRP/FNR family transcriptional regulator, cyclic AMP receptor protein
MPATMESLSETPSTSERSILDPLAFLPCSVVTKYKVGQAIYSSHQPSTQIFLIVEGRVKVSRQSSGAEVVVDVYQPDEFFGESALLGMEDRVERAVAIESSRVMRWSREEIEENTMLRPKLGLALLQLMARRTTDFEGRIQSFSGESVTERLTRALIRFAARCGTRGEDGTVTMPALTHELLSKYVGTSREIVTHHMNQFRRNGYLQYSRDGISLNPCAVSEWQIDFDGGVPAAQVESATNQLDAIAISGF